jgi:hypothetical protein
MLLLHTAGPTGWDNLRSGHPTFVAAAKARGLIEDSQIWVDTILEALCSITTLRRRISWVAVLFANANITDAADVLEKVIADHRKFLTPRSMQRRSLDDIRQFVLLRMEYILRLQGVDPGNFDTCCDSLGLGHPENFNMNDNDMLQASLYTP